MCEAARNERCYQAPFRRVRDTGERVTRLGLVWPLMLGDGPWASRSTSRGDVAQRQASQLIERRIRLKHVVHMEGDGGARQVWVVDPVADQP